MADRLADRTAIVTGAAQGIGKAIAERFAEEGAAVVVADVQRDAADETAADLRETGADARSVECDVTSRADVRRLAKTTVDAFGGIDVLVNNAGIATHGSFTDLEPDEWDRVLDVNLTGVYNCSAAVVPQMIGGEDDDGESGGEGDDEAGVACDGDGGSPDRGLDGGGANGGEASGGEASGSEGVGDGGDGGAIVNVSSMAGRNVSYHAAANYTASKWGVIGLTKHMAWDLGSRGVRVNAVCPGSTLTPLTAQSTTEADRADTTAKIPLGRWAAPRDIADGALYLASDAADFVSGTVLEIDGGKQLGVRHEV